MMYRTNMFLVLNVFSYFDSFYFFFLFYFPCHFLSFFLTIGRCLSQCSCVGHNQCMQKLKVKFVHFAPLLRIEHDL